MYIPLNSRVTTHIDRTILLSLDEGGCGHRPGKMLDDNSWKDPLITTNIKLISGPILGALIPSLHISRISQGRHWAKKKKKKKKMLAYRFMLKHLNFLWNLERLYSEQFGFSLLLLPVGCYSVRCPICRHFYCCMCSIRKPSTDCPSLCMTVGCVFLMTKLTGFCPLFCRCNQCRDRVI